MKIAITKTLGITLLTILFASCGTVKNGGSFHKGGLMEFTTEKLDESSFYIFVKGNGAHSKELIEEVWLNQAKEVSEGKSYKVNYVVEKFLYQAHGPIGFIDYTAFKASGKVYLGNREIDASDSLKVVKSF